MFDRKAVRSVFSFRTLSCLNLWTDLHPPWIYDWRSLGCGTVVCTPNTQNNAIRSLRRPLNQDCFLQKSKHCQRVLSAGTLWGKVLRALRCTSGRQISTCDKTIGLAVEVGQISKEMAFENFPFSKNKINKPLDLFSQYSNSTLESRLEVVLARFYHTVHCCLECEQRSESVVYRCLLQQSLFGESRESARALSKSVCVCVCVCVHTCLKVNMSTYSVHCTVVPQILYAQRSSRHF